MLAGKLAFVTGAGSGIGRSVCLTLARDGARVIAADLNHCSAEDTISQLKYGDHSSCKLDVSEKEEAETCLSRMVEHYNTVPDVLVNCAGILSDSFLQSMTLKQFDDVIKVNLKGTFIMTQLACSRMVEAHTKGSIVNISSIVSWRGNMGQANYAASKAGVEALSRTVAMEMASFGIRCNTVVPGFIETPMVASIPEKVMQKLLHLIPMRRSGKPSEIAEVVSFLASEKSSYITGASIPVTGGFF